MARYTAKDVEKIIAGSSNLAENKKGGYAREAGTGRSYTAADVDAVISRSKPKQSEAGRTSSASSSAVKRTQSTGSNMTDDQILERIRKYTQKGYQMTGAEQEEMRSITDAVNKATSDAINNYTDGQWDFSKGVLPGGTEISGNDYQLLLKYQQDQADAESAKGDRNYLADESFIKNFLYNIPGAKQVVKAVDKYIDPLLGTNLVDSEAMANEVAQMQEDQKAASTAGALGGNLAGYYVGSQFVNAIPALGNATGQAANTIANAATRGQMSQQAVQQGASHLQNVLGDMTLDVTLDTIPQLVDAAENGASAGDIAGLAAESTLQNLALNAGGELFGMAAPAALNRLKRVNDSVSDRAAQRIPFLRDQTPQADSAEIPRLRDRITQRGDLSTLGEQVARSGDNMAETASRVTADAITETAARQTDDFIDMSNVNGMDALDFAEAPKRITSMPKTTVPKSSSFSKLDNEVSKLVRMYGDDSLLNDLDSFRTNIVEFENTGSMQAADNASHALGRLDSALQGRTYTDGGARTKSGAQKRAGTTYTYGREYAGINDLVEDAQQQFDDVFESTGSLSGSVPDDDISEAVSENVKAEESTNTTGYSPEESQYDMQNESFPDVPSTQNVSPTGTKTSKTRTNTMPGTGIMTEEELATRAPEAIFQYVPVNEQETLSQATEMIQRDGAENTLNNLLKKEALTAVDTDALMSLWRSTVQQAQQLDASGVDSTALWERANQIFKKVQEQSTRNGQALQALIKWSQGTPEGMLAAAERAVNNRAFKTDNVDRIQKALDKQLKRSKRQVEFSPEFQKEFLNLAEQATQVSDINSREAKEIMARLGKLAADYLPATLGEKAKTFLMNNMLGNFRTLISRNAGGNLGFNAIEQFVTKPIAAGIDRLAALKTGKRTTAGLSKEGVQEYLSGFRRGIADEIRDVKTGLYTAKTGENTIENAINNNRRVFKNPVLNAKDAYVRHGLSVGDRPFYEAAYSGALSDVYQLRRKGLLGDEIQGLSDDAFKEYAETVARQRALEAVYQDNSLFSRGMSKLKEGLSDVSKGAIGVDVLSQTSMPFTRTPANIVSRSIEYSPLGFLKNGANTFIESRLKKAGKGDGINQSRLAMETARNLVGSGIFAGGALAAKNGLMSGGYSDDKDMRNAQKASGMQEYALDTGNGYLDLGWVPVLGNSLIAGAAAYDAAQKDPDATPLEVLGAGASAGIEQLFGQSMFQGLNRVFGGDSAYSSGSSIADNVVNAAKQGITQLNPSMLRQVVQSLDEYDREVYNSENDSALNNLMSGLPFLRQELQPKVDNEGNLVKSNQGRGLASRLFENMISPAKYTEKVSSPINDEAMRLFEATGNNYAFVPTAARNDLKADDGTMPTDEAFREYRQNLGTLNSENAEALINSDYYKGLSDEEKEIELRDLYTAMKVVAKEEAIPGYESDNKLAAAYSEYGGEFLQDYMAANNAAKGISDGDGLASVNWREALRAVNMNPDLSSEEKGRLLRFRKENDVAEDVFSRYGNDGVFDYYSTLSSADKNGDGDVNSEEFIPYLMDSSMDDEKKGNYLIYSGAANIKSDTLSQVYSEMGSEGVYHYKAATSMDYNGDGKKGQDDMISYLDRTDLSPAQKAYLFRVKNPKSKKRPWG